MTLPWQRIVVAVFQFPADFLVPPDQVSFCGLTVTPNACTCVTMSHSNGDAKEKYSLKIKK